MHPSIDSVKPSQNVTIAELRRSPPVVLTLAEAAQFLACSDRTLRTLVRKGRIRASRIGNRLRFARKTLEQFAGVEG